MRIRDTQNLLFGAFLLLLGAAGFVFGQDLEMGSAVRMGPGYFPKVLAGVLVLFGAGFLAASLAFDGPRIGTVAIFPLVVVVGVVVLFAVVIERAGLVLTIVAVVLLSSLAAPDRRWLESALFAAGLAAACAVIFKVLLNLHLPVWPQW